MTIEQIRNQFDASGLIGPQPEHTIRMIHSLLNNGLSLDNSHTGTGKTYVAGAIARHIGRKIVVICPKLSAHQWEGVLAKFGLKAQLVIGYEKLARGNTPWYKRISQKKFLKLHGNIFGEKAGEVPLFLCGQFKFPKDSLVILDEVHRCKGVESLNAGLLFNLKMQGYLFHLASATVACTPLDMRALGYAFKLHDGTMKKFKEFCVECGAEWVGKWGAQYFDSSNPESMDKLTKLRNYLFDEMKVASRISRLDMIEIFPQAEVEIEAYDMGIASDKIQAVYDNMEAELARLEERSQSYRAHIFAIITKARRAAELLKVPTMIEMASEFYREDRSVVLFVNYTDTIEALIKRLKSEFNPDLIGSIHGGQTIRQRVQDVNAFNSDTKRFMVANLDAGGTAVNLHDLNGVFPRSAIINPSYKATSVIQAAGRIDRAHALTDVYQRFLLAKRTIEENVFTRFQDKNRFITMLNNGTLSDRDVIPTEHLFKLTRGIDVR